MKMRTARRMYKQAMTISTIDEESGLPTKQLKITESFRPWIRKHFKKLADNNSPSKKLTRILNPQKKRKADAIHTEEDN